MVKGLNSVGLEGHAGNQQLFLFQQISTLLENINLCVVIQDFSSSVALMLNMSKICCVGIKSHLFPEQSLVLSGPTKKAFENIVGKTENAGNHHFLFFLTMLSSLSKTEIIIQGTLNLLSANALFGQV